MLLETPNPIPEVPDLARECKQSGYVEKDLRLEDWQTIIDKFKKAPKWSLICIEPYGGQINERERGYNAFVHRNVSMDLFMDVFWMNEEEKKVAVDFLDEFHAMMVDKGYYNGHSYQNYPRRGVKDFGYSYWGEFFEQLIDIKRKYDAENFFHYEQSIPVEKPQGLKGLKKPLFEDTAIVYEDDC